MQATTTERLFKVIDLDESQQMFLASYASEAWQNGFRDFILIEAPLDEEAFENWMSEQDGAEEYCEYGYPFYIVGFKTAEDCAAFAAHWRL